MIRSLEERAGGGSSAKATVSPGPTLLANSGEAPGSTGMAAKGVLSVTGVDGGCGSADRPRKTSTKRTSAVAPSSTIAIFCLRCAPSISAPDVARAALAAGAPDAGGFKASSCGAGNTIGCWAGRVMLCCNAREGGKGRTTIDASPSASEARAGDAPRMARRISRAVAYLSPGFLERALRQTASRARSTITSCEGGTGSSDTCFKATARGLSPENGVCPVSM